MNLSAVKLIVLLCIAPVFSATFPLSTCPVLRVIDGDPTSCHPG